MWPVVEQTIFCILKLPVYVRSNSKSDFFAAIRSQVSSLCSEVRLIDQFSHNFLLDFSVAHILCFPAHYELQLLPLELQIIEFDYFQCSLQFQHVKQRIENLSDLTFSGFNQLYEGHH